MPDTDRATADRIDELARSLRNTRLLLIGIVVVLGGLFAASSGGQKPGEPAPVQVLDEVRTRRLVVVDGNDVPRVVIQEEAEGADRRARAAGILIFDDQGAERGGMTTMSDGSAVVALDAPAGVGAPMRDRVGLLVGPDGTAEVRLIGNDTSVPVRLITDADGGGGLETLDYDLENRKVTIRRIGADGKTERTVDLGSGS